MSDAEFERSLESLRADYRRRLPGKLAELGERLDRARGGERTALEAARLSAHTLKGTSGSYGFDSLSASFARIEAHLDRLLEGAEERGGAWREIDRALAAARAELAGPGPA